MKSWHAGGNPKPTGTLLKAKIPSLKETANPQRKSLATLEETTTVKTVLEQEQRLSGEPTSSELNSVLRCVQPKVSATINASLDASFSRDDIKIVEPVGPDKGVG
ncbi:hypothetical protein ACOSQ3_011410 [Xanthoceras sorbifolium]